MHLCTIEGYTNRHPITRHQRRACREQARMEAGFVALHRRRPAPPIIPVAPSHRQERAATRRSLLAYCRRELTAAAA